MGWGGNPGFSYFNNNTYDVTKRVVGLQKRILKNVLKITRFFIHLVHKNAFPHIIFPSLF